MDTSAMQGYPPDTYKTIDPLDGSKYPGKESIYEKNTAITFSKAIIREKIKQFKLGKYTEKYIRTYLEFVLMNGIIDNLNYLEYLKEIKGEKV